MTVGRGRADNPETSKRKKARWRRRWLIALSAALAVLVVISVIAAYRTPQPAAPSSDSPPTAGSVSPSPGPPPASPTDASAAKGPVAKRLSPTDIPTADAGATALPVAATVAPVTDGPAADAALQMLNGLPVKGRAPTTGYDRSQFGQPWTDDVSVAGGHNGCDTRNDMLRRDLQAVVIKPGSNGCTVLTGALAPDPYTGRVIVFTRGAGTSSAVQIDHVVALSDAWQTGAQRLTLAQRTDLANDPLNLQATDGPTNQQKGDGDAATWLPPRTAYRCTCVARQVEVKARYHLWVTPPEKAAIMRVLASCGATTPATSPPPPTATIAPQPALTTTSSVDVYYDSCAAVYTAGKAPLYRGQPGYRSGLDGDSDGIACEVRPTTIRPSGEVYYKNCAAVYAAHKAPLYAGQPGYRSRLDGDSDGIACENPPS
jgi:hypothetical protein